LVEITALLYVAVAYAASNREAICIPLDVIGASEEAADPVSHIQEGLLGQITTSAVTPGQKPSSYG